MTPSGTTPVHRTDPDIFIDAREALDRLPTAPGAVRVIQHRALRRVAERLNGEPVTGQTAPTMEATA